MPPLQNPIVADLAPSGPTLTKYCDEEHAVTYIRMLDADADGADWRDVSRIVLRVDPDQEPEGAKCAYETHLARPKWAARTGYKLFLRAGGWRQ
jgi:hypothetical protein